MKNLKTVLVAFAVVAAIATLFGFTTWSLLPDPVDNSFMRDEHSLRKMSSETTTSNTASGGFFLFVGGFKSSSETETLVKFAWKLDKDTYILSSLPFESIRVKINDSATVPTIRFVPTERCEAGNPRNIDDTVNWTVKRCLRYAIVTVKDSDWPIQIDLPLNQPLPAEKE